MADITTDVLIVGTGPAGSAAAALLSTYGVENMLVINRYRWLARHAARPHHQPAHDGGAARPRPRVEDEALHAHADRS